MSKPKILATGLNGLVGSRFKDDFSHSYDFDSMDLSDPTNPVDITNKKQIMNVFGSSSASFVIHLAAFTDVTKSWEQSGDKNGLAYRVNVDGTQNIVDACKKFNKHLIHISTAYVFDGEKTDPYLESDIPNPIEWYGKTKTIAEEIVQQADIDWTILRIDQPFRSDTFPRLDTAHRIIEGLKSSKLHPQFRDHFFGPTFIDDFAKVIDWVIRTKTTGLFNASSGEKFSDYQFAKLIAKSLNKEKTTNRNYEIKPGNLEDYLKSLDRPYQKNTSMNCNKLKSLIDFSLTPIESAIDMTIKNNK